MKHTIKKLIFAIIASFVGIGLMAAPAQAGETEYGSVITSSSESSSVDEAALTSAAYIDALTNAKTLAYIKASGMAKSDHKYSKPRSITLKRSASYYTSYKNYAGKEVWHWKWYPKGKKFYLGRDGWYHDPNCYNKIVIKGKKKPKNAIIIKGKVKIVKSFTYTAAASAKLTFIAMAKAKAWCRNEYTSAEAEGSASTSGEASAKVTATGSTKGAAEAAAKGAAKKLALSASFQASLKARLSASVKGKAEAEAKAKVTCSSGPTTPSTPKPQLLDITLINRVLVGNEAKLDVSGRVQGQAELFCQALNGGTIKIGKLQTVQDTFTVSITYVAPGEIPDVRKDDKGEILVPAGHDRVKCTLSQGDQEDVIMTEVGPGKFDIYELRPDPQ